MQNSPVESRAIKLINSLNITDPEDSQPPRSDQAGAGAGAGAGPDLTDHDLRILPPPRSFQLRPPLDPSQAKRINKPDRLPESLPKTDAVDNTRTQSKPSEVIAESNNKSETKPNIPKPRTSWNPHFSRSGPLKTKNKPKTCIRSKEDPRSLQSSPKDPLKDYALTRKDIAFFRGLRPTLSSSDSQGEETSPELSPYVPSQENLAYVNRLRQALRARQDLNIQQISDSPASDRKDILSENYHGDISGSDSSSDRFSPMLDPNNWPTNQP